MAEDMIEVGIDDADLGMRSEAAASLPSPRDGNPYPTQAILTQTPEKRTALISWLDEWVMALHNAHEPKLEEWAQEEIDYEAEPEPKKTKPFVGACNMVVPVIGMAVDPVWSRLDTGLFGNETFQFKAMRKSWLDVVEALQEFVNFYAKHKADLRRVAGPCLLDIVKHGTGVLRTEYDYQRYKVKSYDKNWAVVTKEVTRFKGPRTLHVPIQNFMFPPYYQHLQDCPIVAEIFYTTPEDLMIAKVSNKVADIDAVIAYTTTERTVVEDMQAVAANHEEPRWTHNEVKLLKINCRYDIDGDGLPESLIITYHEETKSIIELRYNWYFRQDYNYTLIPYTLRSGTMYGLGMCRMMKPFQDGITDWQQMASDNAYLANIRGIVARTDCGIEQAPELYAGRVFYVDDPQKDFKEWKLSDIYGSTLGERQNLFGMGEKRSGVSDYLTGRESPVVGSRATATSTVALIQEGKARVESVLENLRTGFAEVAERWIHLWIQYGTDDLEDVIFGMDDTADKIKTFFSNVDELNVMGALGIELGATDPANNRTIQQQTELAIIQVMMQYLEKLLQVGQQALQAQATMPAYAEMAGEVMGAARKMFKDFLETHEKRNAEELLPDLEKYLNAASSAGLGSMGSEGGPPNGPGGAGGQPSIPSPAGPPSPQPSVSGGQSMLAGLPGMSPGAG